jgi:hypothetical protein
MLDVDLTMRTLMSWLLYGFTKVKGIILKNTIKIEASAELVEIMRLGR